MDPTGIKYGEYDFIDGEWKKISNIGDDIGVDFYHMGITNDQGKEITNITDRQGNWIEMLNGRNLFKGAEIRGNDVNYSSIYNEFASGSGPARSIFEGDHPANEDIQEHYLYQKEFDKFNKSGEPKKGSKVEWNLLDVFKTRDNNMQAQMMGSYNANFYKLGDKTLFIGIDSKSKTSLFLHLPVKNLERISGMRYDAWRGGFRPVTQKDNEYRNTHQIYLFWTK